MEGGLSESQFPLPQNGEDSSPWFMRECILNSQCRTGSGQSLSEWWSRSCSPVKIMTVSVRDETGNQVPDSQSRGPPPTPAPLAFSREFCLLPPHTPHPLTSFIPTPPPSCHRTGEWGMRGQPKRMTKFIGAQRPVSLGPWGMGMAVPNFPFGK